MLRGRVHRPGFDTDRPTSPGQLARHYASRTPLTLWEDERDEPVPSRSGLLTLRPPVDRAGFEAVEVLSARGDMREAAANLFAALHRLDALGLDRLDAFERDAAANQHGVWNPGDVGHDVEQVMDAVSAGVGTEAEQVHVRLIKVDSEEAAQQILAALQQGGDFAALVREHSLDLATVENGGDLGFFARGSLLVPAVEEAAFNLQPGEVSEVISGTLADGTGTTFYIVTVIERDPQRELTADLLYTRLQERFESWLAEREAQAEIIRFVDTST